MRKTLASLTLLLAGTLASSAAVTVQGWWHLDTAPTPTADSSGNGFNFNTAYSTAPASGGNMGALAINNGAGGPLSGTGFTSTQCIRLGIGVGGKRQSAMWGEIGYNPPAQNYGIEIWAMPQDNGIAGGSGGWIFSSGEQGGVALRINAPAGAPSYIDAFILGAGTAIGAQAPIDTNRWTHLAIVNDNGVLTFYTNGVACGASVASGATLSDGPCYIGTPGDNQAFDGYLDEARMFTFAPGAFATSDLLLRPAGPNIIASPQNTSVWDGGAAPFAVIPSFDNSLTYQWRKAGTDITGATGSKYVLPTVAMADNGSTFSAVIRGGGISATSAVATLTVVPINPSNVNAYRDAVNGEASLLGYFPVDGSAGATVSNSKDPTRNGTLQGLTTYDGRTNRAFGQRALSFDADGVVEIPNNPAFDFTTVGTLEAVVFMERSLLEDATIFASAFDGVMPYYAFGVTKDGGSVFFTNDSGSGLNWTVTPNLIGRRAHLALVFESATSMTPYVNGLSLGTKTHPGVGTAAGGPAWIGGMGLTTENNRWAGTVDELAVYSTALSQNTVQTHYSKYFYGTNTSAPSIVSKPAGKNFYAGGSPQLAVSATGTLPLVYQWSSNGVPIVGATTATLNLVNTTPAYSASYSLAIDNAFGTTNTGPIALSFLAPPTGYAAAVMGDHPMAFFRLNETTPTVAVDSAGLNDATYSGSVAVNTAGIVAGDASVNFTGGTAQAPWSSTLNNPAGPFTAELWVMPADTALRVPLSSQYRSSARSGYVFYQNNGGANWVADLGRVGSTGVYRLTSNVAPLPGEWGHLVLTYDGTTARLYYNGMLAEEAALVWGTDIGINPSAPFVLGDRNGGGLTYNGRLDEVAVYNYALTGAQITNHWSYIWSPAAVVTAPANVTTNEHATLAISATVSGLPNTYKWQKGGVDLAEATNPDGTAHYPNGVTSSTLVIAQAQPADNGQYRLVVANPRGGLTTSAATLTVVSDTAKPAIASFEILGTPNPSGPTPFVAKITFTERVDINTASVVGAYAFSGGMTPATVTLSADSRVAYITTTTGFTAGQKYTVTATGILDQAQTPNTSDTTPAVGWAPVLTQGVLLWDYYINITPQSVSSLLNSPNYPSAPYTNLHTTLFDSTPITGGDLNNQPAFSGIGGNYGASLSGWITPTVTTNYNFFLTSDDASQLWLSTDATAANAVMIAEETDCCDGFLEPGTDPATSVAIPLTAGQSYFIRALQTEGGGGDYVKVAWRMEFDPTASTNLVPIASTYLKAYAAVPAPRFNPPVLIGSQITISWTGGGTLLESVDMGAWTPVAGNPASPYTVAASAGKKFYRISRQ